MKGENRGMKYEKAMVKVINLGNEDILTCSTDKGCTWPPKTTTGSNKKKKNVGWGWGWGWPWGGWWF